MLLVVSRLLLQVERSGFIVHLTRFIGDQGLCSAAQFYIISNDLRLIGIGI